MPKTYLTKNLKYVILEASSENNNNLTYWILYMYVQVNVCSTGLVYRFNLEPWIVADEGIKYQSNLENDGSCHKDQNLKHYM